MSEIDDMLARVRKQREEAEAAQSPAPVTDPIAQGSQPAPVAPPQGVPQAAPAPQAPTPAPAPEPGPAPLPVAPQAPAPQPGSEFGAVGSPDPFGQVLPPDPQAPAASASIPQTPGHPETTWEGRAARIRVQRQAAEIVEANKPSGSMIRGFNTSLANLLGYPLEVVNEAMGFAGYKWREGGDIQRAVRDGFKYAGITTTEPGEGDIWDQIGSETLAGVVSYFGLRGISPRLAAVARPQGGPTGTLTMGEKARSAAITLGEETLKRPVTSLMGNVTSAPGVVIGGQGMGDIAGDFGEKIAGGKGLTSEAFRVVGRTVGEVSGGLATGVPGTAAFAKLGRGAYRNLHPAIANKIPGAIPPDEQGLIGLHDRGIIAHDADPASSRTFAISQIRRETEAIDRGIANAIARVAPDTPISEVGADVRRHIVAAEKHASQIVDGAWGRTDAVRALVAHDMDSVEQIANTIRQEMFDRPSAIPETDITRIMRRAEDWRSGAGPPLTVGSLLDIRSELLTAARNAARGSESVPGNPAMERSLYQLVEGVEQDIEANTRHLVGIERVRIEQALAVTRVYHDRFSRGPVGELLRQTGSSTDVTDPGQTVEKIMRTYGGTGAIAHLTELIPRSYMQRPFNGSPEAIKAMDQGLRKSFQDQLQETVATTAQNSKVNTPHAVSAKALRIRPEYIRQADQYAHATGEINKATERVVRLAQLRDETTKSALARVAAQEPSEVVSSLLTHPNPAAETRRLAQQFSHDPAALDGFKAAVVEKIIGVDEGRNLTHVAKALRDPRQRSVLEAALSPAEMERMERMAQSALEMSRVDPRTGRTLGRKLLNGFGTVVGMHVGRGIAHVLAPQNPAASLKWPGTGVRLMQNLIQKTLPAIDPHKAFVQGIFDPHWERWLNAKIPANRQEAARYFELQKRAMFSLQAARDRALTMGHEGRQALEIYLTKDGLPAEKEDEK